MLAQEDLQQIVAAILNTPHMKWIEHKMSEEQHQPAPGTPDLEQQPTPAGAAAASSPLAAAAPPAATGPSDQDDLENLDDILGEGGENDEEANQPAGGVPPAPTKPKEKEPHMAGYTQDQDVGTLREQYTQLAAENENLKASNKKVIEDLATTVEKYTAMKAEITELQHGRADAHRRMRLNELAAQHPHFVDLDEECQSCLYSAGAAMDDEAFEKHMVTLEKYAQRSVVNYDLPEGGVARSAPTGDRKSEYDDRLNTTAVDLYTAALGTDHETTDWNHWVDAAKQKLATATV